MGKNRISNFQTASKHEIKTEPFETNGMDIELWAKSTFYGVPKLGIMWDGYSEETADLILGEAQQIGECIYYHPAVPGLVQQCTAILNAIRSGKLQVKNRGEVENMIGAYLHFLWEIPLYNFVEFLVDNDPNRIPVSMSVIANHIESKKKSETKSEEINPKWETSLLKVLATFYEYTMGNHKNF